MIPKEHQSHCYEWENNLCTKGEISDLAQHIIEITDSKSEIIYVDERKGDVKHSLADLSKTKDLLGYKPEYSSIDTILDELLFII